MRSSALPVRLAAAASVALSVLVPAAAASAVEPPPALAAARDAAFDRYQSVLKPALSTSVGWNGSLDPCTPGAPSAAGQAATLTALNFVRELAGLTPVTFDAGLDAKAQQAALMMDAQNDLSHYPDPTWACYSAQGAAAAGQANLFLGITGARAMTGYMEDYGAGNHYVGHRRWILYPPQKVMGSGSTSGANALMVFGQHDPTLRGPDWVAWPTPGYFPAQLEPRGRWSLSAPDQITDFTQAQVTVRRGGVELPVREEPVVNGGVGNNTLVWQVDTGGAVTKQADTVYEVSVTGVVRNGALLPAHSYTTTIFDAEIDARQTVTLGTIAGMRYGDLATPKAYASSGLPVTLSTTTPSVCAADGTTVRMTGVGTCTVHADQSGDAIRRPAPRVSQTFSVAPRPVVVRASDASRAEGDADPAFAVAYDGLAPGQTRDTSDIQGSPVCASTATASSPPGTYPLTCDVSSLTSAHYSFSSTPGVLTVLAGDTAPPASLTRLSGSDRVATAVRISQQQYAGTAPVVFVATASSFPDALAGGPAAVAADGPILLTQGTTLPASTRAEIARLKPGRIFVLGGPAAVPAGVVGELQASAPVERLAGADRASTAAAVSARFFPAGVPVAFVATSANFPDALAAGAAAAASDGPVLLTGPTLTSSVRAELARLKPGRIVVVGGTNAVPAAVLSELGTLAPASRIAGADRYDTGARVVKAFFDPARTHTAVLATGTSFPDALAGTPLAGRLGAPLVLVSRDALPTASQTALTELGVSRLLVLGGTSAVSDAVATKLRSLAVG